MSCTIDAMSNVLTARATLSDEVLVQVVSGEAVLLDLLSGAYFGLNDTGARFWDLLGRLGSGDLAVSALLEEFDVEEDALRSDMRGLLQELVDAGLVTLGEGAPG